MKLKCRKGDIFRMNLLEDCFGYGQIVELDGKTTITVVIYKKKYLNEHNSIKEILNDEVLFFCNTFKIFFELKRWVIINNNIDSLNKIVLPYYLIGLPRIVEDYFKKPVRIASKEDLINLDTRGYVAPINIVNAFLDYHNIIKSETNYDDLYYDNVLKSRK